MFVLCRSILMPVPKAQRVLAEKLIHDISDLSNVILQQALTCARPAYEFADTWLCTQLQLA